MKQDVSMKLNPGLPWQKQHQQEEDSFHQQIGLKFKEETSKMLHLEHSFVWCCRNTQKVLKCGAGEGWRRSVRPIM